MALASPAGPDSTVEIIGRSSSHFTRVTLIFADELGVPCKLVVVHDITSMDPAAFGGHPALKLPTLRRNGSLVFGTENICRALAALSRKQLAVAWPEAVRSDVARNAQELVSHGMGAQVQLVFGTMVNGLPVDNVYFGKARAGLAGALRWLDDHLPEALGGLPPARALSLLEVTLFCLLEHVLFRGTLSLEPFPALVQFQREFAARPSAQRTAYRFDPAPER